MTLKAFMDLSFFELVLASFLSSTVFLILLCAMYALIEKSLRAKRTIYDVHTKPHQRKIEFAFNLLFTTLVTLIIILSF